MKKLLLSCLTLTSVCVMAQTTLPTKKVTIFKNSTAMIVKEGNAPTTAGLVKLPIPQHTMFGSYFIGSGKDNSIKSVIFRNDTIKKPAKSQSVWQYLAGNAGKPVTIYYSPTEGIDKSVTGKVVDYDLYTGMLRFTTDAGKTFVMHVDKIYQADFKEDPTPMYMADSIKRVMLLRPDKAADNIALQEIYMTGELNWIPSYYLRLKDDKAARLEMKATVENYTEDIRDAEVELVVGSPQMSYSNKPDPMTYDYITVAGYDNNDRSGLSKVYMQSNAMTTFAANESLDGADYFENSYSTEGEKNDDQYIYKLGKVSIPNQSKGSFPIFAGNVEYKDKYEGTIYDFTNFDSNRFVPDEEKTFDVFHSLEVKNTSNVPLTTAAVMVVNEKEQFVAQDQLKYTPVGANTTIRLSKAIDIVMKNNEEEKTRIDNAKRIGKTTYSRISIKGTVTIQNFQQKEVTVAVSKMVDGVVTAQSDEGKATKKTYSTSINPYTELKWDVKLGANEKKTLTYEYEVLFVP
ncbi:MAG: hypothetical protein U0V74_05245 [Chitinophagales bacterium]